MVSMVNDGLRLSSNVNLCIMKHIFAYSKYGKLWFASLEQHKPFVCRRHANGLRLSSDINHLQTFNMQIVYVALETYTICMLKVYKWSISLERRKPFACFLHANGLCRSRDVNHLHVFYIQMVYVARET